MSSLLFYLFGTITFVRFNINNKQTTSDSGSRFDLVRRHQSDYVLEKITNYWLTVMWFDFKLKY